MEWKHVKGALITSGVIIVASVIMIILTHMGIMEPLN